MSTYCPHGANSNGCERCIYAASNVPPIAVINDAPQAWCPHNQPPLFCTVIGCPHRFVPVEERLAILEKRYDILHQGRQADASVSKLRREEVHELRQMCERVLAALDEHRALWDSIHADTRRRVTRLERRSSAAATVPGRRRSTSTSSGRARRR